MNLKVITLTNIFFLALFKIGYSQVEKGNFRTGGTIGFNSSKTTYSPLNAPSYDSKTIELNFDPNISYFAIQNLSVGVLVPASYYKLTANNGFKRVSYSIGPVIRYYFTFNKWALFPQASYAFTREVYKGVNFDQLSGFLVNTKIVTNYKTLTGGLGVTYFINKQIGVEGLLNYKKIDAKHDNSLVPDYTTPSLSFTLGLQVYLGSK